MSVRLNSDLLLSRSYQRSNVHNIVAPFHPQPCNSLNVNASTFSDNRRQVVGNPVTTRIQPETRPPRPGSRVRGSGAFSPREVAFRYRRVGRHASGASTRATRVGGISRPGECEDGETARIRRTLFSRGLIRTDLRRLRWNLATVLA